MKNKCILIIDDSDFDRELLSKALTTKLNCKIYEFSSYYKATQTLKNENIDLILVDVDMPLMMGFEVVSNIRSNKKLESLPIIMVSGKTQDSLVIKCLKAGANDYITKPINFEVAITRITNQLILS